MTEIQTSFQHYVQGRKDRVARDLELIKWMGNLEILSKFIYRWRLPGYLKEEISMQKFQAQRNAFVLVAGRRIVECPT